MLQNLGESSLETSSESSTVCFGESVPVPKNTSLQKSKTVSDFRSMAALLATQPNVSRSRRNCEI